MSVPWLHRYTGSNNTGVAWTDTVLSVDGWSVATDGKMLLAIGDGGRQEFPPAPAEDEDLDRGREEVRRMLTDPRQATGTTTLDALAVWCGFVQWCKCEACQGGPHALYCEDCDGDGRWLPSPLHCRPGYIGGAFVDRNRLAWALAPELWSLCSGTCATLQVGSMRHRRSRARTLVLWNARVHLVVARIDRRKWRQKGPYPTFHPDPEYQGLLLGGDEARPILADWLEEHGDPYASVLRCG